MTTRQQRDAEFVQKLNKLLLNIRDKAMAQHEYNEKTNIPQAISKPEETVEGALRNGVVSGWNLLHEWDTIACMELAFEVLEDANCHSEAGLIWNKLEAERAS